MTLYTPSRRTFLQRAALGSAALFTVPGAFAEKLVPTASMTEGPFYPDKLPLDTDNDLLIINDGITPAVGEITHLSGRVLNAKGTPLRNAFVEIWQTDNNGSYLHTGSANRDRLDAHFQGYGRFLTDVQGRYYFRTIKPVSYPGRTPHIHVAVSRNGQRIFTSQILIQGHEHNERDGLYQRIQPDLRKTVLADFKPVKDSKLGELSARFDMILGHTVEEREDGTLKGGIGEPEWGSRRRRRG
jgi:protocatechuate 3,4-dioxygenase beta subunit